MKKILLSLLSFLVIAFAGLKLAEQLMYSGETYYVQVTTEGQKVESKDDSGEPFVDYEYSLRGYDENGQQKLLRFSAAKDRPLRREAFLKVTWNKKKGVTSYEEVQQKELPKKAAEKLGQ